MQNLKKICLSSFWRRHEEGFLSQRTALKVDVTGPENTLFAGASFSLEILQAGAVKGLIESESFMFGSVRESPAVTPLLNIFC